MPRILVVDDEPHILEVVQAYLLRDGYAVSTATDGRRPWSSSMPRNPS